MLTQIPSLDAPAAKASAPNPKAKPGFWKSLDWKLMLALLFPVTLETLDYTGMSIDPVVRSLLVISHVHLVNFM